MKTETSFRHYFFSRSCPLSDVPPFRLCFLRNSIRTRCLVNGFLPFRNRPALSISKYFLLIITLLLFTQYKQKAVATTSRTMLFFLNFVLARPSGSSHHRRSIEFDTSRLERTQKPQDPKTCVSPRFHF